MIFQIDEECVNFINKNNTHEINDIFELLAIYRRRSHNLIIANNNTLTFFANNSSLSESARGVYLYLSNRMAENKLILNSVKKICRITPRKDLPSEVMENGIEVTNIFLEELIGKDFIDKSLLLAENPDDCVFFDLIGQYYKKNHNVDKIGIGFDYINGGGSTIAECLKGIIKQNNRLCLCLSDSDKKYKGAPLGETCKKLEGIDKTKYHEVVKLECHEIENLIPIALIKKVMTANNISNNSISFIEFLQKHLEDDGSIPAIFFDYKKGIPIDKYLNP